MPETVKAVKDNNICISCGACKAICPRAAISYKRRNGMYLPQVAKETCVSCGLCFRVCPGKGMDYTEYIANNEDAMFGNCLAAVNAWSRNALIRHKAASGGVVTAMLYKLLNGGHYDAAYVIEGFEYSVQVKTSEIRRFEPASGYLNDMRHISKSRYIPVSHEDALRDMLKNPHKKIILIGVSCAIQMFRKFIAEKKLIATNYLLVGLFCENVLNYNVWDYFSKGKPYGQALSALHFKNKESGGWPGDMKLFFSDNSSRYVNRKKRMEIKKYFKPERCLYCIDKLNICADISLGDNYTGIDDSPLGSNTVIVRTKLGSLAWDAVADELEIRPVSREKIAQSQKISESLKNDGLAQAKAEKLRGAFPKEWMFNVWNKKMPRADERRYRVQTAFTKIGGVYCRFPIVLLVARFVVDVRKRLKSRDYVQ